MKKIYMTPQIEEVEVKIQQLMEAASSFALSGDSATVTDGEYSNSLSRGGGWFDDDEEEDY